MQNLQIESCSYHDFLRDISELIEEKISSRPEPTKPPTELLTQTELANQLKISPVTLWRKLKSDRIPYVSIGKRRLFILEDVLKALENKDLQN